MIYNRNIRSQMSYQKTQNNEITDQNRNSTNLKELLEDYYSKKSNEYFVSDNFRKQHEQEIVTLSRYQKQDFRLINRQLRSTREISPDITEKIRQMEKLFSFRKLEENTLLFRGASTKVLYDSQGNFVKSGSVIEDKAFISTTITPFDEQSQHRYAVEMTIIAKKGQNVIPVNELVEENEHTFEQEFILPGSTNLRIVSVNSDSYPIKLIAEII
jgi:hypothetical protein